MHPSAHHAAFLRLLPKLQLHARISFRSIRCPDQRQDRVCEVLALCWKWFVQLTERGKDPTTFPGVLAAFAARAVHNGRRLCGQEKAKDVLSGVARRRQGYQVVSLPLYSTLGGNELTEALRDNCRTPPDEQAAFRLDWPCWLTTRTERDRRLITDLMAGERTCDVAKKYGLSPARVSQLRREFHQDWCRFQGEEG